MIKTDHIQDERNRAVPFTKRKTGLLKKAREPSILCDCESAVHNTNGRCFEFASGDTSRTLTRFATFQGTVELRGLAEDERARLVHRRSLDPDSRHLQAVAAATAALCRAPPDRLWFTTSSSTSEASGRPRRRATSARHDGYGGGDGKFGYAAAATPPRPPAAQQFTTSSSTSEASGRPRRRATSARHDGYGGGDGPVADARFAYPPAGASGPAAAGACQALPAAATGKQAPEVSGKAVAVAATGHCQRRRHRRRVTCNRRHRAGSGVAGSHPPNPHLPSRRQRRRGVLPPPHHSDDHPYSG
ncbi:hypothetical protein BU14_0560s0006 [Porphyra umbilicalis]|uniref:MADS-box domain-containing protein n=1 Tax=Porphyra umbilicalis TaxID=2786 RepID=A0A1X6NRV3_PORUM|nr:hypothetical protein BU14_0560s0006 [Porphyra umbilicalis]|eukprot:OSX71312.1 hypothetical protein BU14_0560s0006 [Porphyra umbilicalis]